MPRVIRIDNPRPGEPRYMRLRSPLVVRLHKFSKEKDAHAYYFSELQLYRPFLKEEDLQPESLERCKEMYDEVSEHNNQKKITNVKNVLMEHLELVEQGTDHAQEIAKSTIGNVLDPQREQDDDDCTEEGLHEDMNFLVKDPETLTINDNSHKDNSYRKIELYSDQEIKKTNTKSR